MKLNRNQFKYIAIAAMLIDHIAWGFVPSETVLALVMHFIGRFTGPVMAYFVYEGFVHTSDRTKYGLRLAGFALISWVPFTSFMLEKWAIGIPLNVMYTLFLGYLAMCYCEKHENDWTFKDDVIIAGLCILSLLGDWPVADVLWPFLLFKYRNNESARWQSIWMVLIFTLAFCSDFSNIYGWLYDFGCILPILAIKYCYSGEPGKKSAFNKWFFYIFYPLHLFVLAYLKINGFGI